MAVKELPEELIAFILCKLSVKSLLRFKCIRKSWYALINSPHFIDLHLRNSNNNCLIVSRRFQPQPPLRTHVISFHSHETLADLGIEINTPFSERNEVVSVSGPCNGLICISNKNDKIVICNPAMSEFRSLFVPLSCDPESGYGCDTVAFGFDPNSYEYKVVMIGASYFYNEYDHDPDYTFSPLCFFDRQAVVYNFSTDSWRDTSAVVPDGFNFSVVAVLLNGAFHWSPCLGEGDSILSFLISDEVTKEIPLPGFYSWEEDEDCFEGLYVLNNSLALIIFSVECFEILVMTEYGIKESWTKLFLLGLVSDFDVHVPLAFWNSNGDDQLLLETGYSNSNTTTQLISCDLQHQNITHFPIYGLLPLERDEYFVESLRGRPSFDVFLYSESLVSVNGIREST